MVKKRTKLDIFDACSTDLAYARLLKSENGKKKQMLYMELRKLLKEFYSGSQDAEYGFEDTYGSKKHEWKVGTVNYRNYNLNWDEAMLTLQAVYADCPLLFFSDLYKTGGNPQEGYITPLVDSECARGDFRSFFARKIEEEIISTVSVVQDAISSEEAAMIIYNKIRKTARYDHNKSRTNYVDIPSHSILNYVRDRSAVCQGFARTYQAFMNYFSIPAVSISVNTRTGVGHACNFIYLEEEEKWIMVDVTVGVSQKNEKGFNLTVGVYGRDTANSTNEFDKYEPKFGDIWDMYEGKASNATKQPEQKVNTHGTAQIRPNDPCPCGSGLKYKNCHGK